MKEPTKEEAIAGAARYIDRARQSSALAAEEWARAIWDDYFSRVRPAAPPVEVIEGDGVRKLAYGSYHAEGQGRTFVFDASKYNNTAEKGYRYIRLTLPEFPPKPAPPMPEGAKPKRIIARRSIFNCVCLHGVLDGDRVVLCDKGGGWVYESIERARDNGWEIEIVEGRDDA